MRLAPAARSNFWPKIELLRARALRNRGPTSASPGATLPEKKQSFAPEGVFTGEFTRIRAVTRPNYLMMGG